MEDIIGNNINLKAIIKQYPQKGNLVYEYNPLRNYRLNETKYYFKNKFYSAKQLKNNFNITVSEEGFKDVPNREKEPIPFYKDQIVDFETDELQFDLNHPVDIIPQYSYDNSVNLIINDGKNKPKLINTRFSATDRNQYQIVDRQGDNDTNIYDQGSEFDLDTSLYKVVNTIPRLQFRGVEYGGKLPVGNYHFYFKYADADGNETDFVAESGLVSMFIGSTPSSIRAGFRNEDSHKLVRFVLSNIDSSYKNIIVYYSRTTSDINENYTTEARIIKQNFIVDNNQSCNIVITGYEVTEEVPLTALNEYNQIYSNSNAQATVQNMLFLANVSKPEIPYKELTDIALRFLPTIELNEYSLQMNYQYTPSSSSLGYYDPNYIYNKVGYQDGEIYRFGIVFIFQDNTLSPVFNTRGIKEIKSDTNISSYYYVDFKDTDGKRVYITYSDEDYQIKGSQNDLENSKGVIRLNIKNTKNQIIGIQFKVYKDVINYLKEELHIKGFFFVRQKRIPTILCQAYTIGIDKESNTPLIPLDTNYITESFLSQKESNDKFNRTENDSGIITHDFGSRVITIKKEEGVRIEGAICPEYDINYPYFNSLFTGGNFIVRQSINGQLNDLNNDLNHFYSTKYNDKSSIESYYNCNIIGVEDNVKLVGIGDNMFSARAGEAEEGFRYEYVKQKIKTKESLNVIRGSYGPYLGITNYPSAGELIDIMVPGYSETLLLDYFKIRYNDKSSYYAISDRIDLSSEFEFIENDGNSYKKLINTLYRGDCYICQFTHRINRNFQDPSVPVNDEIVDPKCWKNNFDVKDGVVVKENFDKINLSDLNAVKLGMWLTITVRSSFNLNIRPEDPSNVDESAMFGHNRTFYPRSGINNTGSYKIPEALCYNKGFGVSTSERWNFEVPDVPFFKNDFSNRIAYSNINITDSFKNGFRVFKATHYRDYTKTYGSIIKLVELNEQLLCVFEHGVALIPVNERAVAGEGSGGNVYINTSNVLPENPKIISDTFGSQWKESVIKTSKGVYGVDTVGKKIWRTNGDQFEIISDFHIQEFLNNNISLTERELTPIIGIRNVKTHYNKFKQDIMFTFYDNLYGFSEKVWNICFNEILNKWITFYSWLPSYSENIHNQFFSFDRNTSKWIAKLGISKSENSWSDGITIKNNILDDTFDGTLSLSNRIFPSTLKQTITYSLERDQYGNRDNFDIIDDKLVYVGEDISKLNSEYYVREYIYNNTTYLLDRPGTNDTTAPIKGKSGRFTLPNNQTQSKIYNSNNNLSIYINDRNKRVNLEQKYRINGDKTVILLNIKAKVQLINENNKPEFTEALISGYTDKTIQDGGYYKSTIALIPKYNMQFLTTDFWKHGQAGIIDIADNIYPTYWYGKQHPFEFEIVVSGDPRTHKIFDNLEIISNSAEPESFHYEIIGDCFDFDKKNMYIRQEATKEFYQYNGSDIEFDKDYTQLDSIHEKINGTQHYKKSTLLPLYYSRQDTINEIEDYYHLKDGSPQGKNFSALAGGEIVRYKNSDEYRIQNHAKAVDIHNPEGRLRGNMQYKEDKWNVQINPINIVQKNEPEWTDLDNNSTTKIPIELQQSPIPDDIKDMTKANVPESFGYNSNGDKRGVIQWGNLESKNSEVKLKDKFIKIRIRYSGEKLAIIAALNTLYSISFA